MVPKLHFINQGVIMGFVSTLFKAGLLKKGVQAAKKYLEHKNKSEHCARAVSFRSWL